MNNQTEGTSLTEMVRQDSPKHPEQRHTFNKFLAMAEAAQVAKHAQEQAAPISAPPPVDALPRVRTLAEITAQHAANRAERRRKHEEERQEVEASFSLPETIEEALRSAYAPRQAQVRVRRPVTRSRPKAPAGPRMTPVGELLDLKALRPKRGLGAGTDGIIRYVELLYRLTEQALKAKGYRCLPSQLGLHLSNELMAAQLGVAVSTIWKWNKRLRDLGFLDFDRHYTGSLDVRVESERRRKVQALERQEGRRAPSKAPKGVRPRTSPRKARRDAVCDGTVYAIRLQPGHTARLTYAELSHEYRDLDADRKAGRTAHAILGQAYKIALEEAGREADQHGEKKWHGSYPVKAEMYILQALTSWAVNPKQIQTPLSALDPCHFLEEGTETVQDVILTIELVETIHPSKRTALVGHLAATLATCLKDEHSHRHYCKLIWEAYKDTLEGRGGLRVLAAQLARLDTDRREWVELRKPAALLAARLRSA